jgi:hypothetical protein
MTPFARAIDTLHAAASPIRIAILLSMILTRAYAVARGAACEPAIVGPSRYRTTIRRTALLPFVTIRIT